MLKPLHIVLLLAAGAAGGALVMRLAQWPQKAAPATMVAQEKAPVQAQVPSEAAAQTQPQQPQQPPSSPTVAAPSALEQSHPSPFVSPKEEPKPSRSHPVHPSAPPPTPQPPRVEYTPPPVVAAPPVAAAEPPREEPAAAPTPPARVEPEHVTPPPPPAPVEEPRKVTLNAGTLIPVRLVDGLSAERNKPGDSFSATLDKELVADGFVIAERGARVEGLVTASDPGGKVRGVSTLTVEITRIHLSDGQTINIRTDPFERRAQESHGEDAAKIGAGAVLGAAIGALAGGGKGAAIGAGAGGGVGAGAVMATRGKPAVLPTETRINFRMATPVTVTERR